MKWIAKIFLFAATMSIGEAATAYWNSGAADRREAMAAAEPSPGVRVMYAGWQYETDGRIASMRLIVHNGLDQPVYYRGFTPTEALPEVRVNGEAPEIWGRCLFGLKDFEIKPGRSAELHVERASFPNPIAADAIVKVGVNLYLSPPMARLYAAAPDGPPVRPEILALTEPIALPAIFRVTQFE